MRKRSEAELKAEIERVQGLGTMTRYGASLRERVLGLLAERRRRGETAWAVAAEVGLPWQTLHRWERVASAAAHSNARAFRRVRVVSEAAVGGPQSFVLSGPAGLSVTGLTVAELATLLRSLAS